jgi:hypothetical protein
MSQSFNLTAQVNLQAPGNLKTVVAKIKRELGTVSADVKLNISSQSARSIDNVKSRLDALNATLIQARTNTTSLDLALRSLSTTLSSIQSNTVKVDSSFARTSSSVNQTSKSIKVATTEMEEFGKQSALAVRRFAAFSIVTSGIFALVNAVNSGFKAFIEFDKELVKLQQVTGKGEIGLRSLEKEITKLSTSLGVSSQSLMSVASTLAQAGLSAEDTRVALEALAKTELAPSFDNLADTTEGAIAAMRQFGLESKDLEKALGSINAVAAAFAVESKDIIAAIQRTGGVFAAASKGVSEGTDALNEFVAVFTSVRATTRESAETIATGLRTIFTRLQRTKTIDQLKDFGVTLTDLEGKFVGPFEAVKRLSAALNQLDPRDLRFSAIVEELGGFRQIGKVIPLIQQFATAQEALKVAQKGQGSLAEAQITAQKSLANQIAKVREQFLALVRDIGKSQSFQGLFKIVTGLASGLISLASAFKPILPILAIMGAIKGVSAIRQFGSGFIGGINKGGGAKAVGENVGSTLSGNKEKEKAEATSRAADAIRLNTDALKSLTTAVQSLDSTIKSRGSTTLAGGGKVYGFQSGGIVPGSGRGDKVPALLEPGEVVMNRNAVNKYGAGNLVEMNKSRSTKGIARGARSRFKELSPEELSQLSTEDMIKYAKAQAREIFSTGGSGMATSSKFIPVSQERITPELESSLTSYLGQKGFWKEMVSPFGQPNKSVSKAQSRLSREQALQQQSARMSDEVAARGQQWASIRSGSSIDNYLLGALKDPILSDYRTVRGGGSLSKAFHSTRLRKAVNEALDNYDDFDYSPGSIDKLVSSFAAKKFAYGGVVQKLKEGGITKELQKQMIEAGGYEKFIQQNMSPKDPDLYEFGLVGLRSGTKSASNTPVDRELGNGKKARIHIGFLQSANDPNFAANIEEDINKSLQKTIVKTAGIFGQDIDASISPQTKDQILEGAVLSSAVGSVFESALQMIGAPYIDKIEAIKSIDFPFGLGSSSKLFGSNFPSNIPTDATRTIAGSGKGVSDFLGQINRFVGAVDSGKFTDKLEPLPTTQALSAREMADALVRSAKSNPDNISRINGVLQRSSIPGIIRKQNTKRTDSLVDSLARSPETIKMLEAAGFGPAYQASGGLIKNFAIGGLADATEEMSGLMRGLYGNRSSENQQSQKKAKQFGKIALRNDGSDITATYFKQGADALLSGSEMRSGQVTASKIDSNLYAVRLSAATKGYGPRLYDVAMEAATENGGMLTSDRNTVSGDAKKVWEYYFKNRGDVKKTPLKPANWTKNQANIDPKLYGNEDTWPPATDPAWVLQSGYSKSPSLINDSNSVVRMDKQAQSSALTALQFFQSKSMNLASGGSLNKTVPAMVSNGEAYVPPETAKKIGYAKLNRMNQADRNGMKGFASGGISVFKGSGSGTSDSIGPVGLPEGSFIIRAKATKALRLNKGGSIGRPRRFFKGGVADKDVTRAQGTVLQDLNQAVSSFESILNILGPGIRDSILDGFMGIEAVASGQKQKLMSGDIFDDTTRGRANASGKSSSIGLQILGSNVAATTETVAHEAGHLADYSLGGKTGQMASDTKGTFQFALVEVVKKQMEEAFKKAGKSADDIEKYLASNKELFAEFFAKASPEVKAIITSTTDAKEGMKALADHLGDAGYTYAGLEASDIDPSRSKPSQKSSSNVVNSIKSTVSSVFSGMKNKIFGGGSGSTPPTAPPSTPWPSSMMKYTTQAKVATKEKEDEENDNQFMEYRARKEGITTGAFKLNVARRLGKSAYEIRDNFAGRKEEMKYELAGKQDRLRNIGSTIATAKFKAGGSDAEAEAARTQLADANSRLAAEAENIAQEMRSLNPTLDMDQVTKASKEIADLLSEGKLKEAQKAMVDAIGDVPGPALSMKIAMEQMSKELGISVEMLERNFGKGKGAKDVERQQFVQSREGQRFGMLAEFAPDALAKFSGSRFGKGVGGAADFISGKGGKFSQAFGKMGGLTGLGGALAVGADQFERNVTITDPNTAGVVGGIGGAGTGLASGSLLGGQIAGPVGALIGGVTGALVGAINGAVNAFQTKKLENNLKALDKASTDLETAFKKLESVSNDANRAEAQSKLNAKVGAITNVAGQANFGAGGTARTITETLRALDPTGLVGTFTGQKQEGEARDAMVSGLSQLTLDADRLGASQLNKASTSSITSFLDSTKGMDEPAKQLAMARANQGYQVMAAGGMKENDIFLSKYMAQQKQQGKTSEQLSKELSDPKARERAIQSGKELLAVEGEIALKQAVLSRTAKDLAVATEQLLDVYRRATASLDRYSAELEQFENNVMTSADDISGNPRMRSVNRQNEQVLGNISAYSMDEVKTVAEQTASLAGGGDAGNKLKNEIIGAKILKDELPKALRGAQNGDVDEVLDKLKESFGLAGVEFSDSLRTQLSDTLRSKTEGRQGVGLGDIADDPSILENITKGREESLKFAQALQQKYNDTIQTAINLQAKYNEKIGQAEEYQRKAASIRINAELELASALGRAPTLNELNQPFDQEVKSMTSGLVAGGTTDPAAISAAMTTAQQNANDIQQRLDNPMTAYAGMDEAQRNEAIKNDIAALGKQKRALDNGSKALEKLANDGTKAANALGKIKERQQLADNARGVARKLLTSDSGELMDFERQMSAYTRTVSGQASNQELGSLQFRQDAFSGLDNIKSVLPENIAKQMEAKLTRSMISANPQGQQILNSVIGMDSEGNPMTVDQSLQMAEQGKDPVQEQYIQAYKAATDAQAAAADALANKALEAAKILADGSAQLMGDLKAGVQGKVAELGQVLPNAEAAAKADPKPEVKTEEPTGDLSTGAASVNTVDIPGLSENVDASKNNTNALISSALAMAELMAAIFILKKAFDAFGGGGIRDMIGNVLGGGRGRSKRRRRKGKKSSGSTGSSGSSPTAGKKRKTKKTRGATTASASKPSTTKPKVRGKSRKGRGVLSGALSMFGLDMAAGMLPEGAQDAAYTAMDATDVALDVRDAATATRSAKPGAPRFGGVGTAVAINTAINAATEGIDFLSDPEAYDKAKREKTQAGLDAVRDRTNLGFASDTASGAVEGFFNPVTKIVEGGYAGAALHQDRQDMAERQAKTDRMMEESKKTNVYGLDRAQFNQANEEASLRSQLEQAQASGNTQEQARLQASISGMQKAKLSSGALSTGFFGGVSENETYTKAVQDMVQKRKAEAEAAKKAAEDTKPKTETEKPKETTPAKEASSAKTEVEISKESTEASKPVTTEPSKTAETKSKDSLETSETKPIYMSVLEKIASILESKGVSSTKDVVDAVKSSSETTSTQAVQTQAATTTTPQVYSSTAPKSKSTNQTDIVTNTMTPEQQKAIEDKKKADKEFSDKYRQQNPEYGATADQIAGGKSSLEARSARGEKLSENQQYELEEQRREEYFRRRNNGEKDLDYDQMVYARQQRALEYENKDKPSTIRPTPGVGNIPYTGDMRTPGDPNALRLPTTSTNTAQSSATPATTFSKQQSLRLAQLATKGKLRVSEEGLPIGRSYDQENEYNDLRTQQLEANPKMKNKQRLAELKRKGAYRIGSDGLPVGRSQEEQGEYQQLQQENMTPYQQAQKSKREAYLSRFRPEVRNRMMTEDEKAAQRLASTTTTQGSVMAGGPGSTSSVNNQAFGASTSNISGQSLSLAQSLPISFHLPSSQAGLDAMTATIPNQMSALSGPIPTSLPTQTMSQQTGSGPQATQQNNSSTATMLSLDPTALEAMTSFNKTFGDYVNQLAGISIPNQVTISGNYTVDLKISGAAAIEALDKKIKEIGETLVTSTDFTTALNELRDETSRATKNAVKSSASRGSVSSSSEG